MGVASAIIVLLGIIVLVIMSNISSRGIIVLATMG